MAHQVILMLNADYLAFKIQRATVGCLRRLARHQQKTQRYRQHPKVLT